jgi:predicted phage-related endonuclease
MKQWQWPAVAAFLITLLAGCAGLPSGSAPVASETHFGDESREVAALLDYHRRVAEMAAADQLREYQVSLAGFERHPGEFQRLRLALLLSLPRVTWHDDARALQLIDTIVTAPVDRVSPRRDLALVMQKFLSERLAQAEELRKSDEAGQKLRAQLAERQRQVRDEQRKAEELEQKLNALRDIDRRLPRSSRR